MRVIPGGKRRDASRQNRIFSFHVIQRVFSLLVVFYGRTQIILCQFQG